VDEQAAPVRQAGGDAGRAVSVAADLEGIFARAGATPTRAGLAVRDLARPLPTPEEPRRRRLIANAGIILAGGLVGLALGAGIRGADLFPGFSDRVTREYHRVMGAPEPAPTTLAGRGF